MKKIIWTLIIIFLLGAGYFITKNNTTRLGLIQIDNSIVSLTGEINTGNNTITGTDLTGVAGTTKTTNMFCGKTFKLPPSWSIVSETTDEVIMKTNEKDTEGYNVYAKGMVGINESIIPEEFVSGNSVANIDCAPGICYGIKLDENTMCRFDWEIYSDQPKPADFGNDDGARYPDIPSDDAIVDTITAMLMG